MSRAQLLVREARTNLDLMNFKAAALNYDQAMFLHKNENRESERLKGDELLLLHGVKLQLDQHQMEEQRNPTPAPSTLPVLHTDYQSQGVQNIPAQDLMVFNKNQAGNSDKNGPRQPDFLSGV